LIININIIKKICLNIAIIENKFPINAILLYFHHGNRILGS
jgi:hypothetical protein